MNQIEFQTADESETFDLGKRIGELVQQTIVVYLTGDLGVGKTRLVQGMADGLEIDPETVQSPTFTIMTPHVGRMTLLHVDAYRIKSLTEVDELGLDDWLDTGCLLAIEWAERIASALPLSDIEISIKSIDHFARKFELSGQSKLGSQFLATLKSEFQQL